MSTMQEGKKYHDRGIRMGGMISGIRRQLMEHEKVRGREGKIWGKGGDGEKNENRKTEGGHRLRA